MKRCTYSENQKSGRFKSLLLSQKKTVKVAILRYFSMFMAVMIVMVCLPTVHAAAAQTKYTFSDFPPIGTEGEQSISVNYKEDSKEDLKVTAYDYATDWPMPAAQYLNGYLWILGEGIGQSGGSKHALTIEKTDGTTFSPTSVSVTINTYSPNGSPPYETDTFRVVGYNSLGEPIASDIHTGVDTNSYVTVNFSSFTNISKLEFSMDYNDFGITNLTFGTAVPTITGYYKNNNGTDTALTTTGTVAFGTSETAAKAGLSTLGYAKLSDSTYVPITITWTFDNTYDGNTAGSKAVTGTVSGTFAGGQTPANQTGTVTVSPDTRTITGYYTNNSGTDTPLTTTGTVAFGTLESAAKSGLSTAGYAKLSDSTYVPITITWTFDNTYDGNTAGSKAVAGTVSGTFAGGQTPANQTGTVTVSPDTRTIAGYYTNNSGTDTPLTTTGTVAFGTLESAAKSGLSTAGYAKLSDNTYVPITITWAFDSIYNGNTTGAKTVTGTVSGTFVGGQTPVNRTGTVTVSPDTRTITGYYTNNSGTDSVLITANTVSFGTSESAAKTGLSTSGYAKMSDGTYVSVTITWGFDSTYSGNIAGTKSLTGTVSGTFAGGQTPVSQAGTVTVSPDTRTITGYYTNHSGSDTALTKSATVGFGTSETAATAGLSTSGYAKLSDSTYVPITITWGFDSAYSGNTSGSKAVTGIVNGTFAGGQTPVSQTGTVTVSSDTRTITGYFANNDGSDTALTKSATVVFGTSETAAMAGLSTLGYAKLSDSTYVPITITWAFDSTYNANATGTKSLTGTVSGTFAGGQTPASQTGTVTVSPDIRTITGYYASNDGTDTALTKSATVGFGTSETAATAGLSTSGYAKLSDSTYVPITITWAFDSTYNGNITGTKPLTGTVSGTFVGGQTPASQTGTVMVTANTDKVLQSITAPTAITNLANGTAKTAAALGLPPTVVLATDKGNINANVSWNAAGSSYDISKITEQTFTVNGTVTLPAGVINTNSISLITTVSVTVKAKSGTSTNTITGLLMDYTTKTVPYGTDFSSLNLPDKFKAVGTGITDLWIKVSKWVSSTFNSTVPGTYTVKAVLDSGYVDSGYVLGSGVNAPEIKVTVAASSSSNNHSDTSSSKTSSSTTDTGKTETKVDTTGNTATVTTKPDSVTTSGDTTNMQVTVPSVTTDNTLTPTNGNTTDTAKKTAVTINVPTQDIVQQLTAKKDVDLTITVPPDVAKDTNANVAVTINANKEVLQAAKDNLSDVTIKIKDADTQQLAYSWIFRGEDLAKSTTPMTDVNIAMSVHLTTEVPKVNVITPTNKGLVLSFDHSGVLPSVASVKFSALEKGFKPGETLYFYYYNPTTKQIESLGKDAYTVDADGYVTVQIYHCSDYVLLPHAARSIILDTRTYTMPSKKNYEIGVKLTNASDTTIKAYSSTKGVANVTVLKSGNVKVTGAKTGLTYIMIDVYDKKNKFLTHASVRVTVQNGVKPNGNSARQYGIF